MQLENAVELIHVCVLKLDTTSPKPSIDVPATTTFRGEIDYGCRRYSLTAARRRGNSGPASRKSHTTSTKGAVSAGMPSGSSAAERRRERGNFPLVQEIDQCRHDDSG